MKKIILKEKEDSVSINDLREYDLIGIMYSDGSKHQLVKVDDNQYVSVEFGVSNSYYAKYIGETISKYLGMLSPYDKAFVFSSAEEFKNWLIK